MTRTIRIATFVLGLLVAAACAEQVGDIDRTQPNKLKKSQFAGVWYSTATVLEAPMPSAVTFIGEMPFGTTGKLVWDIQEKALIAYPATEMYVKGAEAKWQKRQIRNYWNPDDVEHPFIEIYTGNPVAAFTIESHFDVKRQYNAQTGEQTNVIEENTTDRKWWEREYVRVDWSKNLITDFGFLSGQTNNTALNYYVQEFEADNPDRPPFEPDYMDFVMRYYVEPDAPQQCFVMTAQAESFDCVGTVIKVRYAFKKVPVGNDYIPWSYTNWDQQDLFGFFLTERYGYDEDFGTTYHGKVNLINRWNIWQRSTIDGEDVMVEGAEGQMAKACLYKSDCDEEAGEFCLQEEWFTPGTCVVRTSMAPATRTPKPILYHLSAEQPPELLADAYHAADQWDDVFRDTVSWVQYWDSRGLYEMRSCEVNDDCNQSALFDDYVGVEEPTPCTGDGDCGSNAVCTGNVCMTRTPCDADHPCYYGQSCSKEGFCEQGTAPVASEKLRARAHTAILVAGGDKGATPIYVVDNDYGTKDTAKAAVRLINADPTAGAIDLVDEQGNKLVTGVTYDAATRGVDYTLVAPTASHFYAKSGDSVLASVTYVTIQGGENHLFVYGGGDALVHAQSDWTPQGLRIVNAIGEGVAVDVAVNGALRAQELGFLEATDHLAIGNGDQRLTVVKTGERTDVTCYHYQSEGYCVGWRGAEDDEQIRAAVRARKNQMRSMFVACENVYSGDACTEEQAKLAPNSDERVATLTDCRYAWWDESSGTIRNPCKDYVPHPYQRKKHGDIRYNFFYWIQEEQMASPLGYGPSAADPDTGEIFYGIAHIYGAPLITYYRYCQDLLDLVTGKLTKDDLLTGQFIADYVAARGAEGDEGYGPTDSLVAALSAGKLQSKRYTAAERAVIGTMTHQIDPSDLVVPTPSLPLGLDKVFGHDHAGTSVHDPAVVARMADPALLQTLNRQVAVPLGQGLGAQRLARMKGTDLEAILHTNELKLLTNETELSEGAVESLASVAISDDSLTPVEQVLHRVVRKDRERLQKLASHNVYASDFLDDALLGTAMHYGCNLPADVEQPTTDRHHPGLGLADASGGTCPAGQTCTGLEGDDRCWGLGGAYYAGVLEHEVGHTVGLRHNFNASNDIFNLRPEYYEARTRHFVPCRVRDGREGCEVNQVCDAGCEKDGDCFIEHTCVSGTCVEAREDGTFALNELGEVEEWGVCAYQPGAPVICQTSADCPTGGTCDRDGRCVAKAQQACEGFTKPCAEGQVCDAGTCKVQGAAGLELPEVVVTATDKPHRFKAYIPKVGLDESEIVKRRTEYQYSTLMDYGGRVNFDIQGLGMYDRAAIKMGYGALRDVYANTAIARAYVKAYAKEIGYPEYTFAFYLDGDFWKYAGGFYSYYHPLFFLNYLVGGPAQNYRRISVPYHQVKLENQMAKAFNREELDRTYIPVPYHYMGDEYNGNTGTYTWDLGIDMGEITYHMYNNLHDYYAFDAFKRESYTRYRGGATTGYLSRIMERWLPPMKDAGMSYAFMVQILSRYSDWQTWQYNRMEGWEKVHTAQQSFRYLSNLLASPWPGSFRKETTLDGMDLYRNMSPWMGQQGSELDITIGDGKFPYTTFWMGDSTGKQMDFGYHFFQHPLFVGSFWEKFGALLALTDSTANFLSDYVGESLSVGVGTSIGFNTVFQDQMTNLLGGIIADDLAQFAGYVEETADGPQFRYRDPFDPEGAAGRTLVEPSIHNLTLKTLAGVFGIVYMPAAFNTNFIDSLAVFLEGSGEEYELYDDDTYGVERVTFLDPFGMKTYVAYRPNFGSERVSPAYDLVVKAQAAVDAWEAETDDLEKARLATALKGHVQTLDMLRVLHRTYGTINY